MTLSPAMLEYLRARCGDVPEIRLLLEENERLRETLRACDRACEVALMSPIGPGVWRDGCRAVRDFVTALGEREP